MLTGSDFYTQLIKYNGFLLHSSCIVVDNAAYAFSADSGTGKSTHTELWLKYFGNRAYIDGKVYACGTPWSGKYDYSTPQVVELAGICFLQRSENNWIKKAETSKAVINIFSECVRQLDAVIMEQLFDVLEQIFKIIIPKGKGIEINTGSMYKNMSYAHPHMDILKLYKDMGGEIITVGSDAHKPEYLCYDFETYARDALTSLGYRYYCTFKNRKPEFNPL